MSDDEPDDDPEAAAEEATVLAAWEAVKEARREARAAIPAIYVDTWAFLTWKGHVRLVLGEALGENNHYRAAFVMDLENAEGFAEHLLRVVKRRKEKDLKTAKDDPEQESET